MQNSWFTEEGRDGGSAAKIWTQSQNRGSTSDQIVTPSSAHPDEMKTPDPNLLVDIDFDPPCVVNGKREIGERRPRDSSKISRACHGFVTSRFHPRFTPLCAGLYWQHVLRSLMKRFTDTNT
jgi:hypothetical protein